MTKKDNDVLKKTLKHYIELDLYANGVADDINVILEDLIKRCNAAILDSEYINTKTDYKKIDRVINEYLEEFQIELNNRLETEADIIKTKQTEFLSNTYGPELAIGTIALSKILFTPFDNKDTVKTFAERSIKNIKRTYDTSLRSGYLFGQKAEDVRNQTVTNIKQVSNGIRNGVITAIPSFAKTTDRLVFYANNIEVVWVSTLDGHTCLRCASLSGTRYKSITSAPPIPLHCLCRCILIPVRDITEPVPDFEGFINSLEEEEQKEVLGTNRFNLWKEYEVPLNKFLNDGRVIRLEDLDKNLKEKSVTSETTAK